MTHGFNTRTHASSASRRCRDHAETSSARRWLSASSGPPSHAKDKCEPIDAVWSEASAMRISASCFMTLSATQLKATVHSLHSQLLHLCSLASLAAASPDACPFTDPECGGHHEVQQGAYQARIFYMVVLSTRLCREWGLQGVMRPLIRARRRLRLCQPLHVYSRLSTLPVDGCAQVVGTRSAVLWALWRCSC